MKLNNITLLIAFSLFICNMLPGCAKHADGTWKLPLVYRVNVQQGNFIEQSMLDKLEPGMPKSKVNFIMGTPLLIDPFHSNRWEYVYSIEPGDGERAQRHISLFFEDDKLTHLEGDISPGYGKIAREKGGASSFVVPEERKKRGFLSNLFGSDRKKKTANETDKEPGKNKNDETEKRPGESAKEVEEQPDDALLPLPESTEFLPLMRRLPVAHPGDF